MSMQRIMIKLRKGIEKLAQTKKKKEEEEEEEEQERKKKKGEENPDIYAIRHF